jgi:hypothetical protein
MSLRLDPELGGSSIPGNRRSSGASRVSVRRLSLESLAVHLDLAKLLNVSLADAMDLDFARLKESCGITDEEFIRLKRYRLSMQ